MDYNIKEILKKYWEGESTLAEEGALKSYFKQKEIDKDLEQYKSLFTYFDVQHKIAMSADVKSFVPKDLNPAPGIKSLFKLPTAFWRMAAAVALMVGFFLAYQQIESSSTKNIVWEDTYEDPEEAYLKTKEVLLLLSKKMKNGTDKAAYSVAKAQIATNIIK